MSDLVTLEWLAQTGTVEMPLLAQKIKRIIRTSMDRGHSTAYRNTLCILYMSVKKVRSLEQQNKLLETEIEALQNRYLKPTGLRLLYEEQLKELKRLADQMRVHRVDSLFTILIHFYS